MLIEIVTNSYKLFFFHAGFLDYRNWPSEKKTKQNKTKQNKTKQNKTKQNKTKHQDLGIGGRREEEKMMQISGDSFIHYYLYSTHTHKSKDPEK